MHWDKESFAVSHCYADIYLQQKREPKPNRHNNSLDSSMQTPIDMKIDIYLMFIELCDIYLWWKVNIE